MKKDAASKTPLLGENSGVRVEKTAQCFEIVVLYDRELNAMLAQVEGVEFDKAAKVFRAPLDAEAQLTKVVAAMREEAKMVASDLEAINELAMGTALQRQSLMGVEPSVAPQVSSFVEPGKVYRGPVVNANTRFVAQETGFGKQDGAAFIQIHRLANLPNVSLFKGDSVAIAYDEKFVGVSQPFIRSKPLDVLETEFESQLGQTIEGVAATDRGNKIGVKFEYNAHMAARIRRVDGATFNKKDTLWEIPKTVQPFALLAIADLREIFVLDAKDVAKLTMAAEAKIDNPKIFQADVRAGSNHFGVVLAVGDRFALQSSGRGNFNLHHLALLDQIPVKGHDVKVFYRDGVGAVVDQSLQRGAGLGR